MDRARRPPAPLALPSLVIVTAFLGVACLPGASRGAGSPAPSGGAGSSVTASSAAASSTPAGPAGPTPSPSFVRPTPTPMPTFLVYTVARGDSLGTIARRFGTTARSIAFWNRSTYPSLDPEGAGYRPNVLQVGWTLLLIPNAVFDEQTLPEPSDLVAPSEEGTTGDGAEPSDAEASAAG